MYECPNCAGNLKFDIASQQLYCEHCETQMDPYSIPEEADAEETVMSAAEAGVLGTGEKKYLVTVFTCPQCGAELLSEDNTAATFCSFCGSATILDSRISRERRPARIIPFLQTREDCRKSYKRMMRRALFAPRELKDEAHIEKFRGIYMPYWVYSFEKKGPVSFQGSKSHRRGDYRYTRYYDLHCELDEKYEGLAYDASASFSDHLSGAIAPFDLEEGKPFVPTFLSGFYADAGDVAKYVYKDEARELVVEDGCRRLGRKAVSRRYNAGKAGNISTVRNAVRPSRDTAELAMVPVWFLSYRSGDRVSYAVVNGQTGKAAADIPVDPLKYVIGSVVLAVPLFVLLNLFLTVTPVKIMGIAMLLALISILISNKQISELRVRETGADDKGLQWYRRNKGLDRKRPDDGQRLAEEIADEKQKRRTKKKTSDRFLKSLLKILLLPFYFMFITWVMMFGMMGVLANALDHPAYSGERIVILCVFWIGLLVVLGMIPAMVMGKTGLAWLRGFLRNLKANLPTLVKPLAGILVSLVILLWNPVEDWFYYGGAFLCMGTVIWSFLDIIRQHNKLTTRKLPQFNRRGGDEDA